MGPKKESPSVLLKQILRSLGHLKPIVSKHVRPVFQGVAGFVFSRGRLDVDRLALVVFVVIDVDVGADVDFVVDAVAVNDVDVVELVDALQVQDFRVADFLKSFLPSRFVVESKDLENFGVRLIRRSG